MRLVSQYFVRFDRIISGGAKPQASHRWFSALFFWLYCNFVFPGLLDLDYARSEYDLIGTEAETKL